MLTPVNYYRRYVGDYLKKTLRLSPTEHGIYCLLLDFYYAEEMPIPLDMGEVRVIAHAATPIDHEALDKVLARYFTKQVDGYHNTRADEEIAVATKIIDTARENGKLGGRPRRKNPAGNPSGNPAGNPEGNPDGTENVTREEPANNHPPTSNLQPLAFSLNPPNHQKKNIVGLKPDFTTQAKEILNFLNERAHRNYQPVPANLSLIVARLKEGATVLDCRQVIAKKTREWESDEKMTLYTRPKTLFGAQNFAQYRGELVDDKA